MLIITITSSALTSKIQKQEKIKAETAREKMRANLLRAVSHDLRTPLTGIIGNSSSYLEMQEQLDEEEKTALITHIQDDANWLLNMVENLLSVTRIDNETAQVNKAMEAIDDLVGSAIARFRKRFPEAEVHVKVPDDFIMVMMDSMLIEQVLINILQNSWFHANSRKPVELYVEDSEDEVSFHVRDYGNGIDPEQLTSIFDGEGRQHVAKGSDSHKGMGIGLSICKTIISAHGGVIGARNHDDGAEFYFSLPKELEGKPAKEEQ